MGHDRPNFVQNLVCPKNNIIAKVCQPTKSPVHLKFTNGSYQILDI